jgi:hypothetical protein
MIHHRFLAALGVLAAFGSFVHAEEASPFHNAISFSVGLASGSDGGGRDFRGGFEGRGSFGRSSTGGALGGTLLRDLSDRVVFEASGAYLDRGASHAVSAMGQLLVTLIDGGKAVPYLSAGGGVYHQESQDRFVTPADIRTARDPRGPRGQGRDAEPRTMAEPSFERVRSTDPALSLGGGVRLDLGPRFYARPDARLMMVMGDGRNQTFGLFTMNVGWRF